MKFVVLDRDGVINQDSDDYIKSADEWLPIEGSLDAIASLGDAGYKIVVATNQSGIGRGLFDEYTLARIHTKLCSLVEESGGFIEGIFYCPHTPDENCDCRKPGVGLLQQIESEFDCSLSNCFYVGDSYKDIQAALTFGCRPILVRTGKGAETEKRLLQEKLNEVPVFDDLVSAVRDYMVTNVPD